MNIVSNALAFTLAVQGLNYKGQRIWRNDVLTIIKAHECKRVDKVECWGFYGFKAWAKLKRLEELQLLKLANKTQFVITPEGLQFLQIVEQRMKTAAKNNYRFKRKVELETVTI